MDWPPASHGKGELPQRWLHQKKTRIPSHCETPSTNELLPQAQCRIRAHFAASDRSGETIRQVNVGQRYTLVWKAPHRIEATITDLERDYVVVEATHRCPATCAILQMRATIPIEGEMRFRYPDFSELFLPLNDDGIALPA